MGVKGDVRRALILEAALGLFSARGFDGVSTRAIAESAGITESALFRYFSTKRELYEAVLQEQEPSHIFPDPDERAANRGFERMFRTRVVEFLDSVWSRQSTVRVEVIGILCNQEEARRGDAPGEHVWQEVEAAILHASTYGETRADRANACGAVVASAVIGFLLRVFIKPPADWEVERDAFMESLCSIVLPMILIDPSC